MKKGFIINIEKETRDNSDFRRVLYTSCYMQLVVMSLDVGEEIGSEVHGLDQFIRVEQGEGVVVLNGETTPLREDEAVVIPAGTEHNVINTGNQALKLYTIYAPPEHQDGIIQARKEDAFEEHYDGKTTE